MRLGKLIALPIIAALIAVPAQQAQAQVKIDVKFGTRLGPEIGVFAYSPAHYGDWHANYRKWTPVTLYDVNGHYYHHPVDGSRAIVVYSYNGEYFFPPADRAWVGFDRRYDYHHAPVEIDLGRAHQYEAPPALDHRLGAEIGVFGYSSDRAGDWHRSYKRWMPVTVYEYNGRYYQHSAPGARAVQIYSYHDEYFLPPTDHDWVGFDRRFDYKHMPTDEDRRRIRERP
jgi:hypothetical protein